MDRLGRARLIALAIFLAALAILGVGIERTKVAATLKVAATTTDPVVWYPAQDETIFANSSITMVVDGHWLTPRFLGRIYLLKAPLQLWLSALSMKLLGISLFALRLPMLIAAVFGVVLAFWWLRRSTSVSAGLVAALLLLSDPMWHIFARLCYTDLLLSVFVAAALYFVLIDPRFDRRSSMAGFAIATAAAIMTKSVAGVIPILTLLLFALVVRPEQRPSFTRIATASLLALALAAPWHIYQFIVHRQWFWADYVDMQLLAYGLHPPGPPAGGLLIVFFAKRLFQVDPLLCVLGLAALPGVWKAAKSRNTVQPILLCVWLIVACMALSSFQARGQFRWILFAIPPLAILAACYAPVRQKWLIGLLVVAFTIKTAEPSKDWGLSFGANPPIAAESWLRAYSDRGRANPLVLVDTDDDLYSATLPLPKIHYCWINPTGAIQAMAPHYVDLGITVTAAQFINIAQWEPVFRERLRQWGLDSDDPIATSVVADSDADVAKIVAAHPEADYYLPTRFQSMLAPASATTHDVFKVSNDRFFLLSRRTVATVPRFRLPADW